MRFAVRSCSILLFVFAGACSDSAATGAGTSAGTAGTSVASTGSGGADPGSATGSAATTGGGNPGATGGSGGGSNPTGGSGGTDGTGTGGAPPADAATPVDTGVEASSSIPEAGSGEGSSRSDANGGPQSFACTLLIGCFQTSQWYDAGFETAVGNAKWEIKWEHNTFTEHWASPTDAFWNIAVMSPCTSGAAAPDRVIFVSYSMTLTTEAAWEMALSRVVDNIKTKFPSAKQIDLLGMVRAPNNQMCPGNSDVSTVVRPEEDQAMQAVADKSGGMVQVGPKYFAPSCDSFITNNTNLTPAAASAIAPTLAAVYK